MNVFWFVADIEESGDGLYSRIASVRLRCLVPLKFMGNLVDNCNVSLFSLQKEVNLQPSELESCDVAIIGKAIGNVVPIVDQLKQRGVTIVLDLCDDPFEMKHLRNTYNHLLPQADIICTASDYLSGKLAAAYGDKVCVIEDPLEYDSSPVDLPDQPEDVLSLCWFGQALNLKALTSQFESLGKLSFVDIRLSLVTNAPEGLQLQILNSIKNISNLHVRFIEWSREATVSAIQESHIVLVPVAKEEWAKSKTANRVVMAIQHARPCVAGDIPSYRELESFIEINEDLAEGIQRITNDWNNVQQHITLAQEYVSKRFSPTLIAEKWSVLLEYCRENRSQPQVNGPKLTSPNGEIIRLNLGCGDKILKNYINVDLVDERAGNKPDVVCDIRELSVFENNYADEILTVHVIEHFYFWEAQKVLQEWVRVLKPGGRMIVECPNLLSACEEVLKNPTTAVGPGKSGQRTMWVLYGDPAWKDPLMCHKWLYTPHSLADLMASCGLENIRQEPAQFKLREPRDMRLVGEKRP